MSGGDRVDGRVAGSYKSYRGLTFMKLSDAGHLVPMDQPRTALDMVTKFHQTIFIKPGMSKEDMEEERQRVLRLPQQNPHPH